MQRWNYAKCDYEPYEVPEGWKCPLTSADMNLIINCASCGRELTYGDAYTSREIHTEYGMGYPVCEACYEQEELRENEWRRSKEDERITTDD